MATKNKTLECPQCGAGEILWERQCQTHSIFCKKCNLTASPAASKDDALKIWNERVGLENWSNLDEKYWRTKILRIEQQISELEKKICLMKLI